jgi:DNA polymerase-3 subunit gamma/tau
MKVKESAIVVSDSLAVKYRPQTIEDMIGNASAKKMILGMLKNKRFPNTILLHGGTGKGKTTLARMLARYINCSTGNACGTCPSCRAGNASTDVVEMNMADTRGIDDIRALISKSKLAPRYNKRIFILDELHQISPAGKEAMLKPLEEPPKNTMWILCTTNPEKLTKTIIGRCQQIVVEAPTAKEMTQYLIKVAKSEGFKLSKENDLPILKHIADRSMGHSRNALQTLETFLALRSADSDATADEILKSLAVTTEEDLDDIAAHLMASILKGEGREAVKLLFQMKDKDPLGVVFKMRWLLDFKLNEWAGTMKFSPAINQLFLKYYGAKKPVKTLHVIKIMNTLVDCEVAVKTISGLDPRSYFSAKILNDMVDIVSEGD